MRYKAEFRVTDDLPKEEKDRFIEFSSRDIYFKMGKMIGENVGVKEKEPNVHTLEVECFSSEDWSEFKQSLKKYLEVCGELGISTFHIIQIGKMIRDLQSISNLTPTSEIEKIKKL